MAKYIVFKAQENDSCLFQEQFELWENPLKNRQELPEWYDRLNKLEDDRSFVILSVTIIEYQIDKFLETLIPKSQILITDKTGIFQKIKTIEAFNLIPNHFIEMIDIMRIIRNDFAHNFEIDNFEDFKKTSKLSKHVGDMQKMWKRFEEDMAYWHEGKATRYMFKDIWRKSLDGLRVFESNVKLFRQETETPEFINSLHEKSKQLKEMREKIEKESARNIVFPSRKNNQKNN